MSTDACRPDESRIHRLADVHSETIIGPRTRIWQFVVVMKGARIGADCNICANCLIEGGAVIGDRVTIKCGVMIGDAMVIEDDVFIGPNACLTNDLLPRSGQHPADGRYQPLLIQRGASIGAGAVILPGLTIGEDAMVGAGAVVSRDVPPGRTVVGNPARVAHSRIRDLQIAEPRPPLRDPSLRRR